MAYPFDGKAIFSTRNGAFARRTRIPSMRIILRSDPNEDQRTMALKLQEAFPEVCKKITSPVTNNDVYEYFDYCDAMVHGFEFLRAVLEYIAGLNASVKVENATKIRAYLDNWRNGNPKAFNYSMLDHSIADTFTDENIKEHGVEFLTKAITQIKCLAMQENDKPACQSALQPQMQHEQMTHGQRDLTRSPKIARPPFPTDLFHARVLKAGSDSDNGHQRQQAASFRRLSGPPGQPPGSQDLPLKDLTSSTETLDHVHPEIINYVEFQSDMTASKYLNTSICGASNDSVGIASRALPGPFTYQPVPPSTQFIPLLNRRGSYDSNLAKGKRNPKKVSSDDARMLPRIGDGLRQVSIGADMLPTWWDSCNAQMAFYPRSRDIVPWLQNVRPSSAAVLYPEYHRRPNVSQLSYSSSEKKPPRHTSQHEHAPTESAMKGRSRTRTSTMTNPFSPSPLEAQRSAQDPRPTEPDASITIHPRNLSSLAKRQLSGENVDLSSVQDPPHFSPPLGPHAFGHQFPDGWIDAQCQQNHLSESRPPSLGPPSNTGQREFPRDPGHSRANEVSNRPGQEACKIWIGGLPNDLNKAAVMNLLKPCRGLLDITLPRISKSSGPWTHCSYVFADFQDSIDATEALARIPQTKFPSLPEGVFLNTGLPKSKEYSSPSRFPPIKSHPGEDFSLKGRTTNDHSRKSSIGWGKKGPKRGPEGRPEWPCKNAGAFNANYEGSNPKPEDYLVSQRPGSRAGQTPNANRSSADSPGSVSFSQDPGVASSGVGTEDHAGQGSKMIGDGAQKVLSASDANIKTKGNHRATDSKPPNGCINSTRENPKVSNKLSDGKESGSTTRHSTFEENAERKLVCTSPKENETGQKPFLGCIATEDDDEQSQASVALIKKASGAIKDKTVVSGITWVPTESALFIMPLGQSQEPISQAMRRTGSIPIQGTADSDPSIISSSRPPSSSQTERSSSISQEIFMPPPIPRNTHDIYIRSPSLSQDPTAPAFEDNKQTYEARADEEVPAQNIEHRQIAVKQRSEHPTNLASLQIGKGTNHTQLESQNPDQDGLGGFSPRLTEKDTRQTLLSSSPPSQSKLDGAFVLPSTPIKTHQKKKSRNPTPVKEKSPSEVISRSIVSASVHSSLQAKGGTKRNPTALTIDPQAPTLKVDISKDLPKPETPFLMDDGLRVNPPKINRHLDETSNADRYYAQKDDYQVFHWGSAMQTNAMSCSLDCYDSASNHLSETDIYGLAMAEQENHLEATLREAGFRGLSDTSPFTIQDPTLAWLDQIDDKGKRLEDRTDKDEHVLKWDDRKGNFSQYIDYDTWAKQEEMVELIKKATAARRRMANSPPSPWTTTTSLRQQLTRFVTHSDSDKLGQQASISKASRIQRAKTLLRTVPRRDSPTNEMRKWSTQVSLFMEENAPGPSSSRQEARNSPSDRGGRSVGGNSSLVQQQEKRHLIFINRSDSPPLARNSGRGKDAFPTANMDFNYIFTSEKTTAPEDSPSTCGRLTPSEDDSTLSAVLESFAAHNPVGKLRDSFVDISEDYRGYSDSRHQLINPQEEERPRSSNPKLKPVGEFDVNGISEAEVVDPEQSIKAPQQLHADQPYEGKGEDNGSEEGERGPKSPVESSKPKAPVFAVSKEKPPSPKELEDPARPERFSLLDLSSPFSESSHTMSNEEESIPTEVKRDRRGSGWQRPLLRSDYSAVVGRGVDQSRGGGQSEEEGSIKDPWAIPEGERPWGRGWEGSNGKS